MPLHNTAVIEMSGVGSGHGIGRLRWTTGTGIAPTVSQVNAALACVNDMYFALKTYTPDEVTFSYDSVVQVTDDATGVLSTAVAATTVPPPQTGSGSGTFSSGVGARIDWSTATVRRGRFVHGATFAVPLVGTAYTTSGNIDPSVQGAIETAAGDYYVAMYSAGLVPVVYCRPALADRHFPASAGQSVPIVGWTVSTVPAFLRRRRN